MVKIATERYTKITGKTEFQTRYYISSLPADATNINNSVRSHWSIENKLHWVLDVQFGEDSSRQFMGNSAANFNIISKIALGLIEKVETKRKSKWGKHFMAVFGTDFRKAVRGFFKIISH